MPTPQVISSIDFNLLSYLCFEGGGGKGIGYLGAIQALEEHLNSSTYQNNELKALLAAQYPNDNLFPVIPLKLKASERKFKGICGASAGAICAFFLSLGLTYEQVSAEFEKISRTTRISPKMVHGGPSEFGINQFEEFFSRADLTRGRAIKDFKQDYYEQPNDHWFANSLLYVTNFISSLYKLKPGSETKRIYFWQRILSDIDGYGSPRDYFASLLNNRAFFSGIDVRVLFTRLLKKHLIERLTELGIDLTPNSNAQRDELKYCEDIKAGIRMKIAEGKHGNINFKEFFYLTGVDLVVCGTNMTRGRTFYFSAFHTPLMPVVEAVGISMSFPFVFKPVFLNSDVIEQTIAEGRSEDTGNYFDLYYRNYNQSVQGLYADGGALQNFPLHAFSHNKNLEEVSRMGVGGYFLAHCKEPQNRALEIATHVPFGNYSFDKRTIGFNLRSRNPFTALPHKEDLFPTGAFNVVKYYTGDLMDAFLYAGSEGQVQTRAEYENVVNVDIFLPNASFDPTKKEGKHNKVNTYSIDLFDFATPSQDKTRKLEQRAKDKQEVIDKIIKHVRYRVGGDLDAYGNWKDNKPK